MKTMANDVDFVSFIDPLMVIMNSVELIKLQYNGVMDEKIVSYLNRIEKSSHKIEQLRKELQSKYEVYNK